MNVHSIFSRIRFRNLSRRRVALICLAAGILTARYFQEQNVSQPSQLSVQIADFPRNLHDWSWSFDPSDGREISTYDKGEHVDECSWYGDDEFETCLKRSVERRENARRFIYEHWRSKTLAYISIDRRCIDCAPTDHIFIEPDDTGRWRILIVAEEPRFPPRYHTAHDVTYRRATSDERSEEKVSRILSFKDSSGREIDSF